MKMTLTLILTVFVFGGLNKHVEEEIMPSGKRDYVVSHIEEGLDFPHLI